MNNIFLMNHDILRSVGLIEIWSEKDIVSS